MGGNFFNFGNKPTASAEGLLLNLTNGLTKTDGVSPIGLVGQSGKRYQPGFTPNEMYDTEESTKTGTHWYGDLLKSHIDSKDTTLTIKTTNERFDESTIEGNSFDGFSNRDYLIKHNEQSMDYFKHNLQIDGLTPIQSGKNDRESFDGQESGVPNRLGNFIESSYENNDPVMYGFEVIIDGLYSPLLNGSVEDFIAQFNSIAEVASKSPVIYDFKNQFVKLFRTKGSVANTPNLSNIPLSSANNDYANSDSQKNVRRPGKKAYMSYYLKKIDGLENLVEANSPSAYKYLTDYGKDTIKLTFDEDISGTLGTLTHLYKLLYWSKPNGKGIIPENLLRFNCDIIVSEVRNFNRVRKAVDNGDLQIIKDNVSRYIYSLKECQFYFDKMPHEGSIDLSLIKVFDSHEVSFDYKYSTMRFERWVPGSSRFGTYAGYNNGAIWKIGNKGSRSGGTTDNSVPRFYSNGGNTLGENGVDVNNIGILNSYKVGGDAPIEVTKLPEGETVDVNGEMPEKVEKTGLEQFKENSKKVAKDIANKTEKFVAKSINNQIAMRAKLLENAINKIKTSLGFGGLKNGPKNVYEKPYVHSFGLFFDVRHELDNFLGENVSTALGALKNLGTPLKFNSNKSKQTLSDLIKNYSKIL